MHSKIRNSLKTMLGVSSVQGNAFRRLNVLATLISGVLLQGSSRLSDLARSNCDPKQQASKEKQLSRWIQSEYNTYEVHYLPYIGKLLANLSKGGDLVFSIDGSTGGRGCMILMFSVIYKNRALPLIWQVFKAKKGHLPETAHRDLLARLVQIVPAGCRISIVGDGEYDGCDWQQDILELGWDYVLRTSKANLIEAEAGEQVKIGSMAPEQGQAFFMLQEVRFTQKRYGPLNLMIHHQKGCKDPIYLLSNLDFPPLIAQLYKKRFKIETFFSDQKSRGFNIHRSHLDKPERLAKLLIATCLAYIFCILAGVKASKSKFYPQIQRTDRDDLSLFSIGRRFIELLVDIRQWRDFQLQLPPESNDTLNFDLNKSVR